MKAARISEGVMGLRLTRRSLASTRRKALRHRCWYTALNRLERGIVDLTVACVEEVRSSKLQRTLTKILDKLIRTLRRGYLDIVEKVGRPIAARLSELVQCWGNEKAAEWKNDDVLVRYLGINALGTVR